MSESINRKASITKRAVQYTHKRGASLYFPFIRKNDRVIILIDGANTHIASQGLQFKIDWKKVYELFNNNSRLIRSYYFTALTADSSGDKSSIKPTLDFLAYNKYLIVQKPTKIYYNAKTNTHKEKGNMDVEITVTFMKMMDKCDHIILFSGDGDFSSLLREGQDIGCRITVVSTIKTSPAIAADELRRQADHYVDLMDLKNYIIREVNTGNNFELDPGSTAEDGIMP